MDFDESKPIYQQIIHQIESWIVNERWKSDVKVPSVRELAEELEVNPTTIQRAYSVLEQTEILVNQRGIGKFVTTKVERIQALRLELIERCLEEFISQLKKIDLTQKEQQYIIKKIKESV
ncbi:GntR family transcriptional regulator [Carnobacterium gallinarum]|uniref:GntR family transcriptional regulator n=1 Tax=Carnobacterium gallinarum TaxID=2749 RepID=UPI000550ECBD|nr:GntR family transcriptional regulator [Carnobacterium gallinarum]